MNITFLDGSPKFKDSTSEFILKAIEKRCPKDAIYWHHSSKINIDSFMDDMKKSDILCIAFPLYVDGIPSHLLRLLETLENQNKDQHMRNTVYIIVNCGFYEGIQNQHALDMLKIWSREANLQWGYGIGIGAGGMLQVSAIGKDSNTTIGKKFDSLVVNMQKNIVQENVFVEPNFPRFLYKFLGESGWKRTAKKNHLSTKQLLNQLSIDD